MTGSADEALGARRLLGVVFGASLASATVAASAVVATALALPARWAAAAALFGSVVGAVLSALIGSYALTWRSAALGAACGTAVAVLPQPAWTGWGLVAGSWAAAAIASLAMARESLSAAERATSPALVAAVHTLQLPLMLVLPRGFARLRTSEAVRGPVRFERIRALAPAGRGMPAVPGGADAAAARGEHAPALVEVGFIGHQIERTTGLRVPKGAVAGLAYAAAALAFAWYAVQALR